MFTSTNAIIYLLMNDVTKNKVIVLRQVYHLIFNIQIFTLNTSPDFEKIIRNFLVSLGGHKYIILYLGKENTTLDVKLATSPG